MNLLDWCLLALAAIYALSGYWQGFITGAFATAGLLIGGLGGVWLAPIALGDVDPSLWVSIGALFIVIASATVGQATFQFLGARVRDKVTWQPARALDAVGGAALSAVAVLLVAWALGVAVSGSRIAGVTPAVRGSTVLAKVDAVLPDPADKVLQAFNDVVGTTFFPRYLEPFAPERIVEVPAGDPDILTDPDVVAAQASVVKIRGVNGCGSGVEGTGFIYAPGRVMTNAHVVAGMTRPEIELGGSMVVAQVVTYDSDLDVAVLAVGATSMPHLRFDAAAQPRDNVVVAGYPEDGPYSAKPGRIRSEQRLRSPDIYGDGTVLREVFSVRGTVLPGNSGGPILTAQGHVAGLVFAASVTDSATGYALTADQVAATAAEGITSSTPVATGDCLH